MKSEEYKTETREISGRSIEIFQCYRYFTPDGVKKLILDSCAL